MSPMNPIEIDIWCQTQIEVKEDTNKVNKLLHHCSHIFFIGVLK